MDSIALVIGGVAVVGGISFLYTCYKWVTDGITGLFKPQKTDAPKTKKTPFEILVKFLESMFFLAVFVIILVVPMTRGVVLRGLALAMRFMGNIFIALADIIDGTPVLQ